MLGGNRGRHAPKENAERQAHGLVFTFDRDVEVEARALLRFGDRQIIPARQDHRREGAEDVVLRARVVLHVPRQVHDRLVVAGERIGVVDVPVVPVVQERLPALATLPWPEVLALSASKPMAVLPLVVVLLMRAPLPKAVFSWPVVLLESAESP